MITPDGEVLPTIIALEVKQQDNPTEKMTPVDYHIASGRKMVPDQDFGWLDQELAILDKNIVNGIGISVARDELFDTDPILANFKAAIQAHCTTQAKQYQADLLRARIKLANKLGFDKRLDNPILYCVGDIAIGITEYIAELQTELDKLEAGK